MTRLVWECEQIFTCFWPQGGCMANRFKAVIMCVVSILWYTTRNQKSGDVSYLFKFRSTEAYSQQRSQIKNEFVNGAEYGFEKVQFSFKLCKWKLCIT